MIKDKKGRAQKDPLSLPRRRKQNVDWNKEGAARKSHRRQLPCKGKKEGGPLVGPEWREERETDEQR